MIKSQEKLDGRTAGVSPRKLFCIVMIAGAVIPIVLYNFLGYLFYFFIRHPWLPFNSGELEDMFCPVCLSISLVASTFRQYSFEFLTVFFVGCGINAATYGAITAASYYGRRVFRPAPYIVGAIVCIYWVWLWVMR